MLNKLAIYGGKPIRETMLFYGKQTLDEEDKKAIKNILEENTFLTTGPTVVEFETKCKTKMVQKIRRPGKFLLTSLRGLASQIPNGEIL